MDAVYECALFLDIFPIPKKPLKFFYIAILIFFNTHKLHDTDISDLR